MARHLSHRRSLRLLEFQIFQMNSANMSPSGNEIALAIGALLENEENKSWATILDEFSKLEVELLSKASEAWVELEIRRRICEANVTCAATRAVSVEEYESLWGELISLGFSSFEREASMNFFRAKFLMRNSKLSGNALEAINSINRCIAQFKSSGNDRTADHYSRVYKKLVEEYSIKIGGSDRKS